MELATFERTPYGGVPLGCAPIDFPAVPYPDYFDGAGCVIDGVNDSELTLANAITLLCSGKLSHQLVAVRTQERRFV